MDRLFRFITKININYSKIKTKNLKFINDFFTSNILYLYSYFYVETNILKCFILIFFFFCLLIEIII